jgi:FkbM family methyltransferase
LIENVYDKDRLMLTIMAVPGAVEYVASLAGTYLIPMMRDTGDWWKVILVYLGVKQKADIQLGSGEIFPLRKSNLSELIAELETRTTLRKVKHSESDGVVRMSFGSIHVSSDRSSAEAIANAFITKHYGMIDVKGRDVVDIGAYVGDGAVYYALEGGAKKVYAVEPVKSLSEVARKNAKLNGLEKRIEVIRVAICGKKRGKVKIEDGFGFSEGGVPSETLDSLAEKHRIAHGALKVDCEGCEYDIFRHVSSATLKRFDVINVEYHHGYMDIVERLKKEGYEVSYTKPRMSYTQLFRTSIISGDIIAVREGS